MSFEIEHEGYFEEKIFEVDGKPVRVCHAATEDRKYVEYILEGSEPLTPLDVAKILEVCCSQIMKSVKVDRPIYAKELN